MKWLVYAWCMVFCLCGCYGYVHAADVSVERKRKMEQELVEMKTQLNKSPFGVLEFLHWNHPWNSYKYPDEKSLQKVVSLMKEAGVGWVRVDFLWEDIEPERGRLNFKKYDYIVELLSAQGIGILGILDYSASWASPGWNQPPDKDEDFIRYVSYVVGRYRDKVQYWELWNEPDDEQYWTPQDGMVRYTQLLQKVYRKAKEIDPNCSILIGGLSKSIPLSLKRIYENGGKGDFDILAIHPFVNPLNPADIQRVKGLYRQCKRIMQQRGDDKKIWFTELGCPGLRRPNLSLGWWLGVSPNEKEQAEWIRKIYTELLPEMPDCEKIFWAFFRDCNHMWGNAIDYFGLVRWDYTKKPSFYAYRKASALWEKEQRKKDALSKRESGVDSP
jgi:hypothetical protein